MEKEESGRGSPTVVWWWMLLGRICFGWEKKKEERASDERERRRGNEIELVIFILIKGIVVISSVYILFYFKDWVAVAPPCHPLVPPLDVSSILVYKENTSIWVNLIKI